MMRILRRFFGSTALEKALDRIAFDASEFTRAPGPDGEGIWHSPDGDGLAIHYFAVPPDLPAESTNFQVFEASYRGGAEAAGAGLVELAIRSTQGVRLVYSIVKVPQSPTGMTYVGAITIPFRDFSYVVKVQCEETGRTGFREAMLMNEALADGSVEIEEDRITGDWDPDNASFDERFPDHPLSRLRRLLSSIEATLDLDQQLSNEPRFTLPD